MAKLTKSRHRKVDPEVVGDLYDLVFHLPEKINWLEKGFNTPSYNQKDCGSCYAFSIASSIQGQIFKQTNKLVPLRYEFNLVTRVYLLINIEIDYVFNAIIYAWRYDTNSAIRDNFSFKLIKKRNEELIVNNMQNSLKNITQYKLEVKSIKKLLLNRA